MKTSGVRVRPPRVLQFASTGQTAWVGSPRRLPGRRCEITGWRGKSLADFLREVTALGVVEWWAVVGWRVRC